MQINFPVRYARKNNREKSEPKLHINFRSSLSRCQSGRVNKKKTLRERETGRGWLGTLRRPTGSWGDRLVYKNLCDAKWTTSHPVAWLFPSSSPLLRSAHPCNAVRSLWARCAKTKIKHFTGIPVRHVNYEGSPRLSMWAERIRKLAK